MVTVNLNESELQPQFDSFHRVALRKLAQAVLNDVLDNHIVQSLEDLSDVDALSPDNGDVITFNTGTGKWEAGPPVGGDATNFPIVLNTADGFIAADASWNKTWQYFTGVQPLVDIPLQSSVTWEGASEFYLVQGSAPVTLQIEGGAGVTILSNAPLGTISSKGAGSIIHVKRVALNTWVVSGDIITGVPDNLVVVTSNGLTVDASSNGKYYRMQGGSPSIQFYAGAGTDDYFEVEQDTATQVTFAISGGSFVKETGFNNAISGRYGVIRFRHLGSDVWHVSGDLESSVSPINVQSVASAGTVTPTFSNDLVKITAQAEALTLANPSGTAVDGWGIAIRIKDNGTARAISYGSEYRALGVTLPTTTVLSKTLYLGMIYNNNDTKWDVVSAAQEA